AREGDAESIKVLDFGIAKWREAEGDATPSEAVLGSARYMSPEQARGEEVGRRSDIWSLGVVAYEMLTGQTPFRGANLPDTVMKICAGAFEKPSSILGASYDCFDAVFERALGLDPSTRPETAPELADAFARAAADWKGSATGAVGREGDTATMGATVTAPRTGRARRGGALGVGLVVIASVGAAVAFRVWRSNAERSTLTDPAAPEASATPFVASAAPGSLARSAGEPAASAGALPATASVRPPALHTPPQASAVLPRKKRSPAPARSTDPDFGLSLPAR
ncbi:MAG TPA: protein kinase, partial [Polyangiaceae bacterium]